MEEERIWRVLQLMKYAYAKHFGKTRFSPYVQTDIENKNMQNAEQLYAGLLVMSGRTQKIFNLN